MVTKKEIRDGYDKIYDKIFMSDRFYQFCIKIVDKIQGDVLDIGCGQGFLIEKLLKKTKHNSVVGVDISPKLCSIASARNPKAIIFNSDAENLPFTRNSFDIIFITEVLEHLLAPRKAISEISRVLKPKGKLVLTVPNRDWFLFKRYSISKKSFQPVDDRWYRVREIKKLLSQNGFKIIKIIGEGPLYFSGVLKNIEPVVVFMFPYLNKKMKRLIILSENVKYYGS